MKLNRECVRQILLVIETDIDYDSFMNKSTLINHPKLQAFSSEEILYAILRLDEAGFIKCNYDSAENETIYFLFLQGLTWSGHEFLDSIRDDKIWSFIKSTISKTCEVSLSVLCQFAMQKGLEYLTTGKL